jgi:predicted nucleotidyltransferase
LSTVRITYFDREAVRRALDGHVRALTARHPEITEVVLFGSLVRGTPVPGSDVDLRIPPLLPTGFPTAVDVFPYTRAEIERMKQEGNRFVLGALRDGEVLFRR